MRSFLLNVLVIYYCRILPSPIRKPLIVSVLVILEFMGWLSGSFAGFSWIYPAAFTWTILEEGQVAEGLSNISGSGWWLLAKIFIPASLHDIREVLLITFLTSF